MRAAVLLLLIPVACADPLPPSAPPAELSIGPMIGTGNYSAGMPLVMPRDADGNAYFDFPLQGGHVNYVTQSRGPLKPTDCLTLRYRIEGDAEFFEKDAPGLARGTITLYLEAKEPNWSGDGGRWFAAATAYANLAPGENTLRACFNQHWNGALRIDNEMSSGLFARTLSNPGRIGFVFGGFYGAVGGWGHGVYATAPARFTVEQLTI